MTAAAINRLDEMDDDRRSLILDFTADARDSLRRIEELIDKSGSSLSGSGDALRAGNELRSVKSISMFLGLTEVSTISGSMEKTFKEISAGVRSADKENLEECRTGILRIEQILRRY